MKRLTTLLFAFCFLHLSAQDYAPIASGTVTINADQKMPFTNLRFEDNMVKFFNTKTQTEFLYFRNTVTYIEDAKGNLIYSKNGAPAPELKIKPKPKWIAEKDPLREKNQIRAEILFKTGDTLRTHIKVSTNMFDPEMLNELSVNYKIQTVNDKEKTKYMAEEIQTLRFIDFRGKERKFISSDKILIELLYQGGIQWCRTFRDGSPGEVISSDRFVNSQLKEPVYLGGFSNRRKRLKEVTASRPDLISFINEMEINDENILALMKKFDSK